MNILVVIDMQNDFIDKALGTKEAIAIVPNVIAKIQEFNGTILFTQDTHEENYMDTKEGQNLPVKHCIRGSEGWKIHEQIAAFVSEAPIEKPTFGSEELGRRLAEMNAKNEIESITLVGLCTDICVISNAMVMKVFLPETPIIVDASCCAGVTPESHKRALEAMKVCQIEIVNM